MAYSCNSGSASSVCRRGASAGDAPPGSGTGAAGMSAALCGKGRSRALSWAWSRRICCACSPGLVSFHDWAACSIYQPTANKEREEARKHRISLLAFPLISPSKEERKESIIILARGNFLRYAFSCSLCSLRQDPFPNVPESCGRRLPADAFKDPLFDLPVNGTSMALQNVPHWDNRIFLLGQYSICWRSL